MSSKEAEPELGERELARVPIFPLPNVTLFPGAALPLHVFEARYRELVESRLQGSSKLLAIARLRPGFEEDYQGRPPVFEICGLGQLVDHSRRADGRYDITLRGVSRAYIVEELPAVRSFREVRLQLKADLPTEAALTAAFRMKISSLWERLVPHLPEQVRDLRALTRGAEAAGPFADRLAATVVADPDASQALLEEVDPSERLNLIVERLQELLDALSPGQARSRLN